MNGWKCYQSLFPAVYIDNGVIIYAERSPGHDLRCASQREQTIYILSTHLLALSWRPQVLRQHGLRCKKSYDADKNIINYTNRIDIYFRQERFLK